MAKKIAQGDEVTIRYRVHAGKELVDASSEPITFKIGSGEFFPFVEESLIGRSPGEHVVVFVPPEKHYGRYDPKKLQIMPVEKIPPQAHPGEVIKVQDELGIVHPAILRKKDPWIALVDLNHPFAGKVLRFEVDILDVKPGPDPKETQPEPQGGDER